MFTCSCSLLLSRSVLIVCPLLLLFTFFLSQAMTDKFISNTAIAFQPGQTVMAKVTNLDEEKQRFLVTLKISEVMCPEGDAQTRLINGLQERRAVAETLAVRGMIARLCNSSI